MNLLIVLLFFFLVCFLRLGSFFQSSIVWDESLYLLMARSLIEGHLPYTEIWDNKPPGIYLLFSLALLLFGKSIISIRVITCIAVSITCYLLYKLGNLISKNDIKVGLLAGTLYAFFSVINGGIQSNTELFFATFVICAFYLLFSALISSVKPISQSYLSLFIIGLLMGIGLQIKQVVLFEFIAITIIIGVNIYSTSLNKRYIFKKFLISCVPLTIGFITPFIVVLFWFIVGGHFQEYVYANFYANLVRVGSENWSFATIVVSLINQLLSYPFLWICILLSFFYLISPKKVTLEEKRTLSYILIWFFMAFLGVCAPKSFYSHYFLQILPPLCLLGSYIIIKTIWSVPGRNSIKNFSILTLVLVNPLLSSSYPYIMTGLKSFYNQCVKGINNYNDDTAIISNYLAKRVNKTNYIYVVDSSSIYYYLVPARIPTKYAFPGFMITKLSKVAGIDPVKELHLIMRKKPLYIIKIKSNRLATGNQENTFYNVLDRYLKKEYIFEKGFQTKRDPFTDSKFEVNPIVELYRLKSK